MMLMLVLLGTVFILWLWSRGNRKKNEPPVMSGSKILIGHALQYIGSTEKVWNTLVKISKETLERGGILKTTIGPQIIYAVTDPEDFLKLANTCLHKDSVYDFSRKWMGDGLVLSKPSIWKVHRKLLNPAFNQQVLDGFMDVFNSQARCLIDDVKTQVGKGPFDPYVYTKVNALESICLTALGVDIKEKTIDNTEFVKAISEAFRTVAARFEKYWLHNNLLFNLSSLKREHDKCLKILHGISNKILEEKKRYFINNLSNVHSEEDNSKGTRFKPFIELLLELSRETDAFPDRVIREQVDTFIAAGHDTSAAALMFCMLIVGSYPQVQEKIYEELKNIFCGEDRDVTKTDLSQLVYLEAVIKETMRVFPVVPVVGRYLEEDIQLRDYTLYKGNAVYMFIQGVNHHSMWGPDVEEFKPERWLDASTLPDFPHHFVTFSLGRRNCIGKTHAMTSMKITLAHFFRSYIVHGDHTKVKLKLEVMLKPVSGHHISIEKRNSSLLA